MNIELLNAGPGDRYKTVAEVTLDPGDGPTGVPGVVGIDLVQIRPAPEPPHVMLRLTRRHTIRVALSGDEARTVGAALTEAGERTEGRS